MKIIGFSGLHNSILFKKKEWPGLNEREYRIVQGLDSAAALIIDGEIIAAAEEERFTRKKHTGDFPVNAIQYCLSAGKVSVGEIDIIVHSFDYEPYRQIFSFNPASLKLFEEVYSRETAVNNFRRYFPGFPPEKIHHLQHHLSHASSAYFTSGWDECLVLVIDGAGELNSVSVYHSKGGKLTLLSEISAIDSIGIFYSLITLHLGFDFNSDEYMIMGLAPYGDPKVYRKFFEDSVRLLKDGQVSIPCLQINKTMKDRENYAQTQRYFSESLIPKREPHDEIRKEHQNVAAALQECLERTLLHICSYFGNKTGLRRLVMAGGVALNCTANGVILKSGLFDSVYVMPVAGDDGAALGAALYKAAEYGEVENRRLAVPFFGPAYNADRIRKALHEHAGRLEITEFSTIEETCSHAADLITKGYVLGWYRGRKEYGPRALGNRSIIADPSGKEMRDKINAMVKKREAFRPFAPAVSIEQASHWFEIPEMTEFPYMVMIVDVRKEYRESLPAITHINGTARVQTVSGKDNPVFHKLLQAVGKKTGREMLLNTSFNVKGDPIVNTPDEALGTFLRTGIDYLYMENYFIKKK